MSTVPEESKYEAPAEADSQENEATLGVTWYAGEGDAQIIIRTRIYKKMIVDFAIMLQWRKSIDEEWREVTRIDCSHGIVHWHEFKKKQPKHNKKKCEQRIPEKGWNFVNDQYYEQMDVLNDNLETIIRRWAE